MSEWKEIELGSIAEIKTGPFGSALLNEQYIKGGTPVITVEHIKDFRISKLDYPSVTDEDKNRLSSYILEEGDLVFSRVGSVDLSAITLKENVGWLFSSRMLRVRPDRNEIDPLFLSYYLQLKSVRQYIRNIAVGSTMPSINTEILKSLPIKYCSLEEQKKIAKTLNNLDSKITLLRQQNQTLEELAQTLFKRWFVDFEFPDENGQPYKTSGGKMIESELGEIPKGWEVGGIYNILQVQYGFPFKSSLFNEDKIGKPLIRIRDLKKGYTGFFTTELFKDEYVVRCGDIVAGMDAEFRPIVWSGEDGLLNQRVCRFLSKNGYSAIFILEFIKPHLDFFEKTKGATTVIHLGKGDLDSIEAIIPEQKIIQQFSQNVSSLHKTLVVNHNEIRTLTKLRDTLLPKLMSGELNIHTN